MSARRSSAPSAAAVEALWRASAAPLRAWFERRATPADAEDLVQETFLRVQQRLDSLRAPTDARTVRAWIQSIARRVWIDHLRGRRPQPALELEPADPERQEPDNLDRVVAGWLEAFLDQLGPEDAQALRLTDLAGLEGLTQAQLAERLGLSLSGAKSRVQRARARLRERLEACCALAFDARGAILEARRKPRGGCREDC